MNNEEGQLPIRRSPRKPKFYDGESTQNKQNKNGTNHRHSKTAESEDTKTLGDTLNLTSIAELSLMVKFEAKISYVISLNDFYITKNNEDWQQMEIATYLSSCMPGALFPFLWDEDQTKIAIYRESSNWHRVLVQMDPQYGNVNIYFMDRGGYLEVSWTTLYACPEYGIVKETNPLAYHCTLHLYPTGDTWEQILKEKFKNLHNTCENPVKLTVNAYSLKNGHHSVTVSTGRAIDYSTALTKLRFAEEHEEVSSHTSSIDLNFKDTQKLENSNINSNRNENENSSCDNKNESNSRFQALTLKEHSQRLTKFKIFKTGFGPYCYFIIPEADLSRNEDLKKALQLYTNDLTEDDLENIRPSIDDEVCLARLGPNQSYERVHIVCWGMYKKSFNALHLDSARHGKYQTSNAIKLPNALHPKKFPSIGFWVQCSSKNKTEILSHDLEIFYQHLQSMSFVVEDVNGYSDAIPTVQLRLVDNNSYRERIYDIMCNLETWRYQLLLCIGFSTDEDFMEDDEENGDFKLDLLNSTSTSCDQDHQILQRHMIMFYNSSKKTAITDYKLGQYLAVKVLDDRPGSTVKWHRAVVTQNNTLKCIDHGNEEWPIDAGDKNICIRHLYSEFLRVPCLQNNTNH